MKNQYFGDVADLFKYDLIYRIVKGIPYERFTFVTMLTERDRSNEGNQLDYSKGAGYKNTELLRHLDYCVRHDRRNVCEIESYFEDRDIGITLYGREETFSVRTREEYFRRIDPQLLTDTLVFVDPDIGFQIQKSREKHILYSEVTSLVDRMSNETILMVFQHFSPRMPHELTINKVLNNLLETIEHVPIWICDSKIAFFFLTKDSAVEQSLARVIKEYLYEYPKLKSSIEVSQSQS